MTKRTKQLIILIIALIVVGALAFFAVHLSKEAETNATTETQPSAESFVILDIDPESVIHIDWTYGGFIDESFTKEDGVWVSDTNPGEDFYQQNVDEWLGRALTPFESELKVESDDMSAMGFDDPDTVVHITTEDGSEYTLTFGNSASVKSTCYFTVDGTNVYTVSRHRKASFGLQFSNFQTTTSEDD